MTKSDYSNIDFVFVDSIEALNKAEKEGLRKGTVIVSTNPAILMNDNILETYNVTIPNQNKFNKLPYLMEIFIKRIRSLLSDSFETDGKIGLLTHFTWQFSNLVEYALYLNNNHLTDNVLIIGVDTNNKTLNEEINFPWFDLLRSNNNVLYKTFKNINISQQPSESSEKVSLLDLIWLKGFEQTAFHIIKKIQKFLPFVFSKNTILYTREPPLLRSAALYLALKLYNIQKVTKPAFKSNNLNQNFSIDESKIDSAFLETFGDIIPNQALQTLTQLYIKNLNIWFSEFNFLVPEWEKIIKNSFKGKNGVILTSLRATPESSALFEAAKKLNSKVFSFQHGPARELGELNRINYAYYEGNISNYFFSWNNISSKVSESSSFNIAKSITVGMPKSYKIKALKFPLNCKFEILYASPVLLKGTKGLASLSLTSDYHTLMLEKLFVEKILSKTKRSVIYKKYPHDLRYIDEDPIKKIIKKYPNITLYEGSVELRFFLPFAKIIIVSGTSSSVAWSIIGNRPTVYIHNSYSKPLTSDAESLLKKCVFFFDITKEKNEEQLIEFINKPIKKIEQEWKILEKNRDIFTNDYLGYKGKNEGKHCSNFILKILKNKNTSSNL